MLGLGFRVFSLFGHVFCYHKIKYTILLHLFLHFRSFSFFCIFIFAVIKWYKSDDESCEGSDTEDPDIDFEQLVNHVEEGEDKD